MALPIATAAVSLFRTVLSGAGTVLSRGGSGAVKAFKHTGGGILAKAKTALGAGGTGLARGYAQLPAATQAALRNTGIAAGGLAAGVAIARRD
jgi:hypothetical protein